MAEFLYGSHPKRLIEYIIIVGCQPCSAARRKNFVQNPKLLRRYPAEDHDDFPLPSDVVFFCQPDGCLCSFDEQGVDAGDGELALTFPFTLTEKETNTRRHGVCLNFFRRCQVRVNAGVDDDDDGDSSKISVFTLTSLCLLSHHPFFVPFSNCIATLRRLIEDIPASSPCFNGKVGAHSSEWDDFLSNAKSLKSLELEGWINRLLKSPVPEAGCTRLELELAVQPAITLAYPDESKLFLVDFPVYLPLELLGVDLTLQVLAAILLEQKVVMSAVDYQNVSTCVMAFLVYLYPLEYVYTVIPLLPTSMPLADALMQSPAPFLIGVPASFFHHRRGVKQPNDVWLVDLDAQEMIEPQLKTSLPDLPETEVNALKTKLNKALESLDSLPTSPTNFNAPHRAHHGSYDDVDAGCDPMAIDIAIRVAFIQFMLSPGLLGGLKPHLRCLRLFPKPVVAQQKHFFLRTLVKEQGKQGGPFVKQLVFTQSADCFGEWFYLTPPTSVVMRIMQDRTTSPQSIGDKPKYYFDHLVSLPFSVFEASSPLGEAMLELRASNLTHQRSISPSSSSSSMSSVSSLYEAHCDWYQFSSANDSVPYPVPSSTATTLDSRQLTACDSYDTDYEDDAFMRRMSLLNGQLEATPESPEFVEMDGSTSPTSSRSSMARRASGFYNINPVFVRLTHVEMPSVSTDTVSEVDRLSTHLERMEKLDERDDETPNPLVLSESDTRSTLSESNDDTNEDLTVNPEELDDQQIDRHVDDDLNSSIFNMQEDLESLSVNPFDKRSDSDPGPSSGSPQEIPAITNRHRSASDPQIVYTPTESIDESCPPSPFIRRCEVFPQSFTDLNQRRSQSFDFGLDVPLEPYLERRRISAPAKPVITLTNEVDLPVVVHADWADIGTPNGDHQLLSYHVIRRHSSLSPEIPETDRPRLHHRRHSSESSRGSFQAERFIVKALSSRFARTVKQRWHAGYGVDIMQEMPKRSTHGLEWDDSPLQLLERTRLSLGAKRVESPVMVENEDQREAQKFVTATVNSALKGSGVGFFSKGKLEKYLVDEQLRHLVCTRILEASKGPRGVQVTDVWLDRSIYKGVLALMKACITGLEHGIYSQCQNGIGSAFLLLEIIYTHFTGKTESQASSKAKSEHEKAKTLPKTEQQQGTRPTNLMSLMSLPSSSVPISPEYIDIENQPIPSDDANATTDDLSDGSVRFAETIEMQDMLSLPGRWTLPDDIKKAASRPRRRRHRSGRSPKVFHGSALHRSGSTDDDQSPSRSIERNQSEDYSQSSEPTLPSKDVVSMSEAAAQSKRIRRRSMRKGYPNHSQSEHYMFKELVGKTRAMLWDKGDFWTALFLDTVASERAAVGLFEKPLQLMDRYKSASDENCRAMEMEEDDILSAILHNLAAFMLATAVSKDEIRKRVNRFLGQAHLGLEHTQTIYDLLDNLKFLEGNDVELHQLCSKMHYSKDFMVHVGSTFAAPNAIMVVSNRCLQLKSTKDTLIDRYWYEDIIKVNFHPCSDSLIMWYRGPDRDILQQSYCNKNCRELYTCIQTHLKHAALGKRPISRSGDSPVEYPIRDLNSGEGGCLSVTMDGITCHFIEGELLIPLHNIKDCNSYRDIFEIEEDDGQECRLHRFTSTQCSAICQAVISVFSLVAAQRSRSLSSPSLHGASSPSLQGGSSPSLQGGSSPT